MTDSLPTTRAEALRLGLPRYRTGQPCARGHLAERYTINHACVACTKAKAKAWNAEHPEQYQRWFQANAAQRNAYRRALRRRLKAEAVARQQEDGSLP